MEDKPKIGQGHASAMLRQGAKELAQILPAFPSGPVHPVEEPGLIGNLTPQEIVKGKGAEMNYESTLQSYAQARSGPDPELAAER